MKKMPAGEFKARCLNLMEQVSRTKEPIVITKRGRPVAKLVAVDNDRPSLMGRLEGILQITGDIESPVVPPETWDALR
jgi:prevent-host-death family protein